MLHPSVEIWMDGHGWTEVFSPSANGVSVETPHQWEHDPYGKAWVRPPHGVRQKFSSLMQEPLLPIHSEETGNNECISSHRLENRDYLWKRDILHVDIEPAISTCKPELLTKLITLLPSKDHDDFLLLANRMSSTVDAWYHHLFEELLSNYRLFDPESSQTALYTKRLDESLVQRMEALFLRLLLFLLERSNYSMVTDREMEVALKGSYLLHLPVQVDSTKLDKGLLSRFLQKYPMSNTPESAKEYLLFRRGVGLDHTSNWFIMDKIDLVVARIWSLLVDVVCCRFFNRELDSTYLDIRKVQETLNPGLSFERIRLENFKLSFRSLFSKNTIQEPTFERMILIYRPSTPKDCPEPLGNRSIHLKQFRNIPMADLEIVLPEKVTPGLRALDWARFIFTILGSLGAVLATLTLQFSPTVVLSLLLALGMHLLKAYLAWSSSMSSYSGLLQESMLEKHLDSGRGTLLHLCHDVRQQEFKEAIVSYFVLCTMGKATEEELERRCEALLHHHFGVHVRFEGSDALHKLVKLKIAEKDASGNFTVVSVKEASDIIGLTTDEEFGVADLTKFIEPEYLEAKLKEALAEMSGVN